MNPPNIHFFFETRVTLIERTALKKFIARIFKKEKRELESLNYVFCSDKRLLKINKQYLHHDFYTDIITFELSTPKQPVQGEIYISVDRVRENARELGVPFSKELKRVIFHGALHLCGYKDKSPKEELIMRQKEDFYIKQY